ARCARGLRAAREGCALRERVARCARGLRAAREGCALRERVARCARGLRVARESWSRNARSLMSAQRVARAVRLVLTLRRMRAMVLDQGGLTLRDVPRPAPGPGQLLVRVRACAVCRTDLHVVDRELPDP